MFRSNIGTWCKGTEKYGRGEKVVIAITCKLLATYLQFTCNYRAEKMQEALKMVDADEGKLGSGATLTRILTQKTLNPFITKYIDVVNFKPIICYDKGKAYPRKYKELYLDFED